MSLLLFVFSYGREEMLALFDGNVSPPNDLTNNEELFVNRAQLPLALQAESAEDESVSVAFNNMLKVFMHFLLYT